MDKDILNFIKESNKIEGISSYDEEKQYDAYQRFLHLDEITIPVLLEFALVLHSTSFDRKGRKPVLRDKKGMDVRVGSHYPPEGGPNIGCLLSDVLSDVNSDNHTEAHAYETHILYETLHPLYDGNGRTGRALWAWQWINRCDHDLSRGFLLNWYYQSLDSWSVRGE